MAGLMSAAQLVWFKRDLRLHDHQVFAEAAQAGPVIPLFVVEPDYWRQSDASPRQWRFVRESLIELDHALRTAYGRGLVIRFGDVLDVFESIRRAHGIAALWSHEETGNAWTYQRDRRVACWAKQNAIVWYEHRQDGVIRRLTSRRGWSAHWDDFMSRPLLPQPKHAVLCSMSSDPLPEHGELFQYSDDCPNAQRGGRSQGLALLDSFLRVRGVNYARGMSSPLTAEQSCSRLSPHIAWGTLSMREVVQATRTRKQSAPERWTRPLAAFEARLAWQSHFMQKLESEPRLEFENLHPSLADQRQHVHPELFSAWAEGRTGFPLVDASMRMLHATGWINFRMRAMLASFACYHLWQPWREAGLHLARLFVDYEPGIHWSQMQMQSGSTGINAFRIYNPVKQSRDQDPEGIFIRRWVPELAAVPTEWIHEPWRMPPALQSRYGCVMGKDYPLPIIDHEQAARTARSRLHEAYRGEQAKAESRRIVDRHGSRKRRTVQRKSAFTVAQMGLFE